MLQLVKPGAFSGTQRRSVCLILFAVSNIILKILYRITGHQAGLS